MNQPSDKKLADLIDNIPDPDALEELIKISYERLNRIAKRMLKQFPGVKRWEDTDDVFQRASLRLWKSLRQVQPESPRHFFNLAALQIRRELLELARSLNGPLGINRNQDSIASGNSAESTVGSPEPGSQSLEASRLSRWTDFHESIEKLDEEHKEVFELIWYQGLPQDQIAKLIGVSDRTVGRRWQKARRQLYEILDGQLPE